MPGELPQRLLRAELPSQHGPPRESERVLQPLAVKDLNLMLLNACVRALDRHGSSFARL
jgi:hypothetical protein